MITQANQRIFLEVDKSNGAIMSYTYYPRYRLPANVSRLTGPHLLVSYCPEKRESEGQR